MFRCDRPGEVYEACRLATCMVACADPEGGTRGPQKITKLYGAVTYKRIKVTDAERTENLQKMFILAWISIRIAVYTHCRMNENPCSNQEIHVLFEHGYELENT